jgi:hypothetical protein
VLDQCGGHASDRRGSVIHHARAVVGVLLPPRCALPAYNYGYNRVPRHVRHTVPAGCVPQGMSALVCGFCLRHEALSCLVQQQACSRGNATL